MAALVKVDCAAKETGLNRFTLYKMAANNQIPCYRLGRAIRFDTDELRRWMKKEPEVENATLNKDKHER